MSGNKRIIDSSIGAELRALRKGRRWSQVELAARLGMSQPRLSELERGKARITLEQFVRVVDLFNVDVGRFGIHSEPAPSSAIQNALLRYGASHLVEQDGRPSSAYASPTDTVVQVLRSPESPRHVTALAPVLVWSANDVVLDRAATSLAGSGRERRLGWLLDSTLLALREEHPITAADRHCTRRARLLLELFAESAAMPVPQPSAPLDLLEPEIRSRKTVERLFASASAEAKRWRIVTRLETADFVHALRSAREAH